MFFSSRVRILLLLMVVQILDSAVAARVRVVKMDKQFLPTSNVQVHYNLTNSETTDNSDVSQPETTAESTTTSTTTSSSTNSCNCVCGVATRRQRIVGGEETRVNEFPWIAALRRRGKFYCGGALITRQHVLTAAHCVENFNVRDIRVTLGDHDFSKTDDSVSIDRRVVSAKHHSNFTVYTFNNDIAILKLDAPVDLTTNIRTICLPDIIDKDYTGLDAVVAGWGRLSEKGQVSNTLHKVTVPIMSMEVCRKAGYVSTRITGNMLCAGFPNGTKDACQGDSGGPMHLTGERGSTEIIGIVSWGRGCARPNFPGIYTRVANYIDWIKERIDDECLCQPLH